MICNRLLFWYLEQARREIEAEMKLKESGQSPVVEDSGRSEVDIYPEKREVNPAHYAVSGVFFTCPLIGTGKITVTGNSFVNSNQINLKLAVI